MEQFRQWWESITTREQQLSMISLVLVVIAILYWAVWAPLASQLSDNKQQLVNVKSSLSWTQENADFLLQSGGATKQKRSINLAQVLNSTASKKGITFSRIVNKQNQVEVWIANVEFDVFLVWLTDLKNRYGISVLNTDLAKTDQQGYIKVNRLLLSQ